MAGSKCIGILTSGGDAPGMNAAIRAVTRSAIYNGFTVKGIMRGYKGLVYNEIVEFKSQSVSNIIQLGFRHRLLNHDNPFFFQPLYHINGIMLIRPTLIGIDGNRQVGHRTDCFNHLFIILTPQFYFENIELLGTFLRFFSYHIRRIDTNGKSGRRSFFLIQSPYLIPRSSQQFAHKVVQRNIYSSLSGGISR